MSGMCLKALEISARADRNDHREAKRDETRRNITTVLVKRAATKLRPVELEQRNQFRPIPNKR